MSNFFTSALRPFRFDRLPSDVSLEFLKIKKSSKSLTTLKGERKVGISKELLWERLLFLQSLMGNVPLSDLCHTMRYDGNRVVCSNEYSKIFEFNFKECTYFDDESAHGFVSKNTLDEASYLCYDYIAFNSGGKHEIDYIHTGDDFVSEIWFYPSDRIDGNTLVRDACAVSKLTRSQMANFDYSETMARFKTIHEMESRGMKGKFNGYTTAGNPKHYKFRTTSIGRKTNRQRNSYSPESPNIKIAQFDTQSLLQNLPQACVAYDRFLRHW